jgi:hypothetical protein
VLPTNTWQAYNFVGSATLWPVRRLLDNPWRRLSEP